MVKKFDPEHCPDCGRKFIFQDDGYGNWLDWWCPNNCQNKIRKGKGMYEKLIVDGDGFKVGVKYNHKGNRIIVGGFLKHREFMEILLTDYFKVENLPGIKKIQENKIKLDTYLGLRKWREGLIKLKEDNIRVVKATNLERIMR